MSALKIVIWCFYGVALGCVVTFISQRYESFVFGRQWKPKRKPIVEITLNADAADQLPVPALVLRGYDSHDLFREDLWLRRVAQTEQDGTTIEPPVLNDSPANRKQLCALLFQHAGATSNN